MGWNGRVCTVFAPFSRFHVAQSTNSLRLLISLDRIQKPHPIFLQILGLQRPLFVTFCERVWSALALCGAPALDDVTRVNVWWGSLARDRAWRCGGLGGWCRGHLEGGKLSNWTKGGPLDLKAARSKLSGWVLSSLSL